MRLGPLIVIPFTNATWFCLGDHQWRIYHDDAALKVVLEIAWLLWVWSITVVLVHL